MQGLRQVLVVAAGKQHGQLGLIQQGQYPGMLLPFQLQGQLRRPLLQFLQVGRQLARFWLSRSAPPPGQHRSGTLAHAGLAHHVAELVLLGLQVAGVVLAGIHHQGHPIHHLQAIATEAGDLAGVVGDQAQAMHPQLAEDLGSHAVVAQIGREAEALVGLHRVKAAILQGIGLELVDQANAASLLAEIHHHALTGGLDHLEGRLQLRAAITAQGAEGIAREAFAVHPHQHRGFGLLRVPLHDGHVLAAIQLVAVANGAEVAEGARQGGHRLAAHETLGIEPVADQIGDIDQPQAMAPGVLHQLGEPRHGAIHVLDLTDHPGGVEPRQA